jgi:F-type H+-transporting ATPase subunit alpha
MLKKLVKKTFAAVDESVRRQRPRIDTLEIGTVEQVSRATAEVSGMAQITADELIRFPKGVMGIAADVEVDHLGAILLGPAAGLSTGDDVRRTHHVVSTGVGEAFLGRVVDALGRPLDGKGPVKASQYWPIERPAPAIIDRAPVAVPLQTGIKAIDIAIPIGRGQRELIIGDRQTGKTAIAVDTIVNQSPGLVSIYCAIGQQADAVARVIGRLKKAGALERTIVIVASGNDVPGLQFIAPYVATSMAEWFMERGSDVLIVYDDLTRHARVYRELSLLLNRPPGREAYPGDIFYVHSRLLERATHLRSSKGGGSLTALPIIETQAQNISAYIPTNLISITDGQIYLSPTLFHKGQLPAIDIGRSVSRVGGRAQLPALRAVAGPLKLVHSQFEELEMFARFGTRLDEDTRRKLERGQRVREVLKQPEMSPLSVAEQVAILLAVTNGLFDHLPIDEIARAETVIRKGARSDLERIGSRIAEGAPLDSMRSQLLQVTEAVLAANGLGPPESSQNADT